MLYMNGKYLNIYCFFIVAIIFHCMYLTMILCNLQKTSNTIVIPCKLLIILTNRDRNTTQKTIECNNALMDLHQKI